MNISNKNIQSNYPSLKSCLLLFFPAITIICVLLITGCSIPGLQFRDTPRAELTTRENTEEQQITENSEEVDSTGRDTAAETTDTVAPEKEGSGEEPGSGEIALNVYYADATAEYLVGETRIVPQENKYVEAIYEMLKEPIDTGLIRIIPDTTKINSVEVEDGLARVDLSSNFIDDRFVGDAVDILLVFSVVNTLTEFDEVNSVEFYIDGERLELIGELDLSDPQFRRSDLIR